MRELPGDVGIKPLRCVCLWLMALSAAVLLMAVSGPAHAHGTAAAAGTPDMAAPVVSTGGDGAGLAASESAPDPACAPLCAGDDCPMPGHHGPHSCISVQCMAALHAPGHALGRIAFFVLHWPVEAQAAEGLSPPPDHRPPRLTA